MFRSLLVQIAVETLAILIGRFSWFFSVSQEMLGNVLRLDNCHVLPHPIQFIIH
jgi:hypothetical protein